MIVFTPLRTRRLNVRLNELTIDDAIYLCRMPPHMQEAGITELLKRTMEPETKPRSGQITDPLLMTVGERAMIVGHYIAHQFENNPDFPVGEHGKFSDYLMAVDAPLKDKVDAGKVASDHWHLTPLLGAHAEAIERMVVDERLPAGRHGWWIGAMACQMLRAGTDKPFDVANETPAALEEHIEARAAVFRGYPESAFMDILYAFIGANATIDHLMKLDFDDEGIVFMPVREAPGLTPARFPFVDAVSERTQAVFGNAAVAGD
jgi:hypothetical protein